MTIIQAHGGTSTTIPPSGYGSVQRTIWEREIELRKRGHDVRTMCPVTDAELMLRELEATASSPLLIHCYDAELADQLCELGVTFLYQSGTRMWASRGYVDPVTLRSPYVVVYSDYMRDRILAAGRDAESVFVVAKNIGADLANYSKSAKREGGRVVCVCKQTKGKGAALISLAMQHLPDVVLEIIGPPGPDTVNVWRGPNVHLLGDVPPERVYERMAGASLLVHMSIEDSMSGAILEAMMIGLPVLTTEVAAKAFSGAEFLQVCERRSEVVAVRIRELLARADLKELGAAGQRAALARHENGVVASALEALYEHILSSEGFRLLGSADRMGRWEALVRARWFRATRWSKSH